MSRIQLELSEERVQELEELMRQLGVRTKKDLFNNALTLLEWASREKRSGRIIASILKEADDYREVKELVMPALNHASSSN